MHKILFSWPFISLFLQGFLVFCGLNVLSVLPDHLVAIGASKTYVGLFMNIGSLALVLLVAPLSHFTDRLGRKPLLLTTYVIAIASCLLMMVWSDNLVLLMVLRVTSSLLFCTSFTIHPTEALGMIPRDRRMTGMAIFGISGVLSNPVSAFIGERILDSVGAPWLFVASIAFFAVAMALAGGFKFHKPVSLQGQTSLQGLLKRRELWGLLFMTLMMGGAFAVYGSFLANFTRERLGMVQISLFFTAFSAIAIFIRLFVIQYLEKLPGNLMAAGCFVAITLSFGLSWFLNAAWMLVPIGLLFGLGNSIMFPLLSTAIINTGTDEERLGLNNLFSSVNTLGNILLAMLMGVCADWLGIPFIFLVMAVVVGLTVPVALLTKIKLKPA